MFSASIWQGLPARYKAGVLAVAVLGLVGCRTNAPESGAATQAVPIRVAAVSSDERAQALRFAGVARARQRASLTFQVGGTLATRPSERVCSFSRVSSTLAPPHDARVVVVYHRQQN